MGGFNAEFDQVRIQILGKEDMLSLNELEKKAGEELCRKPRSIKSAVIIQRFQITPTGEGTELD